MQRLLLALTLCLSTLHLSAQVLINEVCAANMNGFADGDGDREDWVELYNSGSTSVNLGGWFLSDDPATPQKWVFPTGQSIPAGGFRTIFCSSKDKIAGTYVHTNFKITQTKNESVVLTRPNGVTADNFTFAVPNQRDHSYGREPNGGLTWKIFTTPTPGAANFGSSYLEYAPAVQASLSAGFYSGNMPVTLSTGAGFTIRYTTNGNEPSATSTIYAGPINIAATTVLKARTFSSDSQILPGFVTANTYFINVNHSVPVVSISGNNVMTLLNGSQIEPVGSLEYFENNIREADGYGEFNKHGNDSWAYAQRGVDWITRDQMGYDDELNHQIFPERTRKKFQRLILKAGANDNYPASGGAHIRDSYVHMLALKGGLNVDVRTHRSCVLYVNGQYWGVYDIREKVDDSDFTKYYYDQDESDMDYIKTWGSTWAEYGGFTNWNSLKGFILNNNMAIQANYNYVAQELDFLSLIDYVIINQHSVCKDWLNWNTSWWRGYNPAGGAKKWRYTLWDMDATFGHYINYTGIPDVSPFADPCDVEQIPPSGDPQNHIDIFMALYANPNFKALYVNRYADLLNTSLSCDYMNALLDDMIEEIAPEMQQQCNKWGGNVIQWNQNVNAIHDFINNRCQVLEPSIVDCYEVTGPFNLSVNIFPAASPNQVMVNSITPTNYPFTGEYFGEVNIDLVAKPAVGWIFDHWEVSGNTFSPNQFAAAIQLAFETSGGVTAYFLEIAPCTPPTGINVSSTTVQSVINWTDQPAATTYLIKYRKVGEPVWSEITTTGNSWNFDTLPGCTQYEGQIQSVCPIGNSAFVDFTFATPDLLADFQLAGAVICNADAAFLDATVEGATYLWNDGSVAPTLSVSSPGDYSVTVQVDGCTATAATEVSQVNATAILQPSLCPGETFLVGGETFDENQPTGDVIFPGLAINGCDSIVQVSLQFLEASQSQFFQTSCDLAAVGIDTLFLTNALGCDSLVITATTLVPYSETFLTAVSCNPNSIGTDTTWLTNQFGCDSLVITTTTFDAAGVSITPLFLQSCNQTEVGVDTVVLANAAGCDSLIITTTSLVPFSQTNLSALSCNPALAGIDTVLLSNVFGCDSLVITTTALAPFSQTNLSALSCNPASIGIDTVFLTNATGCDSLVITTTLFDAGGISIMQIALQSCNPAAAGIDTVVLKNAAGCDSLVVTTTVLVPFSETHLTGFSCNPAAVGVDTVILNNAGGCDSLVITQTNFDASAIPVTSLFQQSCNPAEVGVDTLVLATMGGCDSLVITHTTFDASAIPVTPVFLQSCDPAEVGVDTVVLASAAGCDSLVISTTTLIPLSETFLTVLSCNPNAVGTDTVLMSNQFGCDSFIITTTSFDANALSITPLFAKSCDPALVGVDTVLLTSSEGCDSLVITTTTLAPFSETYLGVLSCNPAAVGVDTLILTNAAGCDSLVITTTWYNPNDIFITPLSVQSCDPAAVGVDTILLTSSAGCDSLVITTTTLAAVNQTFLTAITCDPGSAGVDTLQLNNQFGCDSLIITTVTYAGLDLETLTQDELCFGENNGRIHLQALQTDFPPAVLVFENHLPQSYTGPPLQWENLPAGVYSLTATNAAGCSVTQTLEIAAAQELQLDLGQAPLVIHAGDSIWIEPVANFQVATANWSPSEGVHCPTCPATFLSAPKTGTYLLTAANANGCSTSASIQVQVKREPRIFVPNAIRPGSGGLNERLTVFAGPEVERIRSFTLFDRWGNQIFLQNDLPPNFPCDWDGTFRGQLVQPGVFIWMLTAELKDGRLVNLSGDVTVLR